MRKRIEISYLTFLGLSLTVVITACKDRSIVTPSFLISNFVDTKERVYESDGLADLLQVAKKESGTFIIDDNCFLNKFLYQSTQLLVDVQQRFINVSYILNELPLLYQNNLDSFASLYFYKAELPSRTHNYFEENLILPYIRLFDQYQVRAGPHV